jgi:tetratricopeptide (TPR) repeat protein
VASPNAWAVKALAIAFFFIFLSGCISKSERATRALSRADRALRRGDCTQALKDYSAAADTYGLNGKAYLGMANADICLGRPQNAEPAFVRALDTLQDWPSIKQSYIALSNIYLTQHGQTRVYVEAVGRMADKILTQDPQSFEGHRIWAEAASRQSELSYTKVDSDVWRKKALEEFAKANNITPDNPAVLVSWAHTLQASDPEGARKLYSRVLRLEPQNPAALSALYELAVDQGNTTNAENCIQQATQNKVAQTEVLIRMANTAVAGSRTQDAYRILSFLARENKNPDVLADLFTRAGYTAEAVALLQKAVRQYPGAASHYYEEIIERSISAGQDAQARSVSAECMARFPEDVPCQAAYVFEDYRSNGSASDIEALQRLAAKHPAFAALRLYIGRILQGQGRLNRARFEYNIGLGAEPNNQDLRLALADLEVRSGAPEAAKADAEYLLRRDPQNRAALDVLRRVTLNHQP